MLIRYGNRARNSGVIAYEIKRDFIRVKFVDGSTYTYTYRSAGRENIERMKVLARSGRGLSGYISTHVKDRFSEKR
ncbi:MAG: hypothetical protein ACAH09_01505 [Methylophilaceae bacterium]|jgi:hypothetical protein|nr:hypothetical protein [Methylophilaceae bacterium]